MKIRHRLHYFKMENQINLFGKKTYDSKYSEHKYRNTERLVYWREFIGKLCKDRNEEVEFWFDVSSPYDNEINVRLKSHRCWHNCVDFRFQEGKLKAYDSHFGGGTSFVYLHDGKTEEEEVKEVMERVFNKECSNSSWENHVHKLGDEHYKVETDNEGWNVK